MPANHMNYCSGQQSLLKDLPENANLLEDCGYLLLVKFHSNHCSGKNCVEKSKSRLPSLTKCSTKNVCSPELKDEESYNKLLS